MRDKKWYFCVYLFYALTWSRLTGVQGDTFVKSDIAMTSVRMNGVEINRVLPYCIFISHENIMYCIS